MEFHEFAAKDLFDINQGSSRYTREYVRQHPGKYPVYSATTLPNESFGSIDSFDYESETLTWVRSGYAGHVVLRSGKFSVNGDAGVLLPKPGICNRLHLPYFAPVLTNVFTKLAVGRYKANGSSDYTKVSLSRLRNARICVPVGEDGLPDLISQTRIAAKYGRVQRAKRDLGRIRDELNKARLRLTLGTGPTRAFDVAELFDIGKGDGRLTKGHIRGNPGNFPVYSGSSFRDGVAGMLSTYAYNGEYLTWAADGYAGSVFYRSGKFNANSHAGILRPRDEVKEHLHLPFFEYALTPVLQNIAVGRFKPNGDPDYTRITVSMVKTVSVVLPVLENGLPDRQRQEHAADRIGELLRVKEEVMSDMRALIETDVQIVGLPVD